MAECMNFPATVEEFMEQYKITDTEQIYTNGIELVPIFRMKQWFEHQPSIDVVLVVRCKDCKLRNINGYCTKFQNNISGIATSWFMPNDDGFCSFGKRRKEEDNG